MNKPQKTYIAIDLKSFYASVECVERGLDPLLTHLVVADPSRTEKTICLAVSPSLKSYGIPGRARLFDVIRRVREINGERALSAPDGHLEGCSFHDPEVRANPGLALDYIVAPPQMSKYMEISTKIHAVYLKYVAPEDIYVYSIDEVFIDATGYLHTYGLSAHDLAMKMILDVLETTGITATAGIGENLYLCKVAMDVMAKHIPADENGVRIAELSEMSYRYRLWPHRPITDFWRVGKGYARRLEQLGLYTMGDVALFSTTAYGENKLYQTFGINAELLIDHAWGWEPCTMADIKAYQPETHSISSGQVLKEPYDYEHTRLIVREMTELLALDLVDRQLLTNQIVLTLGYDVENLHDPARRRSYHGEVTLDRYGRKVPKHAHGTENLKTYTSSTRLIMDAMMRLFERIADPHLLVRRLTVEASQVTTVSDAPSVTEAAVQIDLFTDDSQRARKEAEEQAFLEKEHRLQEASLTLKKKFGKNAVLKGMDLQEGATTIERNQQIGGHKASQDL